MRVICRSWLGCRGSLGRENYYGYLIESARQGDGLAIEGDVDCARVARPENNLLAGANRLYIRWADDAAHRDLAVSLNRYPCLVLRPYRHFKRLSVLDRGICCARC